MFVATNDSLFVDPYTWLTLKLQKNAIFLQSHKNENKLLNLNLIFGVNFLHNQNQINDDLTAQKANFFKLF